MRTYYPSGNTLQKRQIHARLIEQGSSFRRFALKHGYKPRTVTQAVARWAGSDDQPRGRLSFDILQALSREIGREIVPGALGQDGKIGMHHTGETT